MPVEPVPSRWAFPDPRLAGDSDVVVVGGDLAPGTVLEAYRNGLFPMHLDAGRRLAWWSPDPRGVIPLDGLRVSRSLRKACRRFEIRVDTAFDDVVAACADPRRPHGWITDDIRAAYAELHRLGWAHSIETWTRPEAGDAAAPELVGGLYGIAVGGLFAGESMFHRVTDASKVALVGLVDLLRGEDASGAPAPPGPVPTGSSAPPGHPERRLLDVQWTTEHLSSLGAVDVRRDDYLERLSEALRLPLPKGFVQSAMS